MTSGMGNVVVELVDVKKGYGGAGVQALAGVSLTIARGELVAVVGPSGSGKSTLLHLVGALDRASSGVVRVHGQELSRLDDDALTRLRRDRIGFVFQFFNLLPTLSALENVMLPSLLAGARERDVRDGAKKELDAVGLSARHGHRPDQLSGGEMQRVAIARALLHDPPLLLADEPTGNLDTKTGDDILALLTSAAERRTVVIVTHDPKIAARCGRVISLRDGVVESDRPPT